MQEGVKDLTESVSIKAELERNGNGPEVAFIITKNSRARLLRRCTSQSLLLNENKKDRDGAGRSRQDSTISSSSSGLLFARPLSGSSREQARPSLFPRPKSSLMSATGAPRSRQRSGSDSDGLARRANSKSSSGKASVPTLVRRSSYFSLQSLRRSISVDAATAKRLTKRGSRDEKDGRFGRGFKGIVTAIDEEEKEEQRQLVSFLLLALLCRFQSNKVIFHSTELNP